MKITGISYVIDPNGAKKSTLYGLAPFEDFHHGDNRGCIGDKTESLYVGLHDVSNLKPGMEIDVYFDKPVVSSKGTFAIVKKIEIIGPGK